ncbi:MAG: hypothetical protein BGO67_07785 [Alphaproteobacteria bacterium 41-28]|nr:MAG: hypothetical protein BGO67_07785 [Alphaproteobacteria bacterium 41-28]
MRRKQSPVYIYDFIQFPQKIKFGIGHSAPSIFSKNVIARTPVKTGGRSNLVQHCMILSNFNCT